jgi:hypothetical protein
MVVVQAFKMNVFQRAFSFVARSAVVTAPASLECMPVPVLVLGVT